MALSLPSTVEEFIFRIALPSPAFSKPVDGMRILSSVETVVFAFVLDSN